MIIFGVTGPIGHGKTSLAEAFLRQINGAQHTEASLLIARVADALNALYPSGKSIANDISAINAWLLHVPTILKEVAHFSGDVAPITIAPHYDLSADIDFQKLAEYLQLVTGNPSLVTQHITVENKENYRSILQWLGGYITKHIHPTLWFDELVREGCVAAKAGCPLFLIGGVRFPSDGKTIKNAGGKIVAIERPTVAELDAQDNTESSRSLIAIDSLVINDASLAALDDVVRAMWRDVQNHNLQKEYRASQANQEAIQATGATSTK